MQRTLYDQFREAVYDDEAFVSMLDDPSVPFYLKQALVKVRSVAGCRRPISRGSDPRCGRASC